MSKCANIDFETDESVPWQYCPAFAPAVLFAALFFLTTSAHIVQAIIYKKKFCWVIIVGGTWETITFALRAVGTKMIRQEGVAVPHQVLVALAPLWVNAYVYMVLGRMIYFFLPEKKCFGITAKRLTLVFVLLDVFAFIVQGSSASLMNSDSPNILRIGINVYMGGIGLQELFVCIFAGLGIRFQIKMQRIERTNPPPYAWRPLLYTVYAGLALITIRIIYRLVEYSGGLESSLAKNEAAFYVLDAATMSIAMLLFNIFHPGRFLVGPNSEFPKKDKKQKKRDKKNAKSNVEWEELNGSDPEVNQLGAGREDGVPFQQQTSHHYGHDRMSNYSSGSVVDRPEMDEGICREEGWPLHQTSHGYHNDISTSSEPIPRDFVPGMEADVRHEGQDASLQQMPYHDRHASPPGARLPYPV